MNFDATVLIPARNAAEYLIDSVHSVSNQNTFYKFEILVINDHSVDSTDLICEQLSREIANFQVLQSNGIGISNALNTGILRAKGKYIVRHDADDLMIEGRIESQINFLNASDEFVMVGGQLIPFGSGRNPQANSYPMSDREIRRFLPIGNPFAHPTVTYSSNAIIEAGLYRPEYDGAEDYELWTRLLSIGKGANLSTAVTKYRIHSNQVTSKNSHKVEAITMKVQRKYLYFLITEFKFSSALICLTSIVLRFSREKRREIKSWM